MILISQCKTTSGQTASEDEIDQLDDWSAQFFAHDYKSDKTVKDLMWLLFDTSSGPMPSWPSWQAS